MFTNLRIYHLFVVLLLINFGAKAQTSTNVVSASFTEGVIAEVQVFQFTNGKMKKRADYHLSPTQRDFLFVIPVDSIASYKFHVNLMKPNGKHFKTHTSVTLPLTLNPKNNYSLVITPSKLNASKKTGWELKQVAKPSFTLIKVSVKGMNAGIDIPVTLHSVTRGRLQPIGSVNTNGRGELLIASRIKEEGFYYLSTPRCRTRVYLEPKDNLELNINVKTGESTLINGSAANQLLDQWQQLISPITSYGYNMVMFTADSVNVDSYMDTYHTVEPAMNEFIGKSTLANIHTLRSIQGAMKMDKELVPMNLLFQLSARRINGFRSLPKNFNEVPASFRQFGEPNKLTDASIMNLGESRQYLNLYAKLNIALLPERERKELMPKERLERMIQSISNDTLRSYFFEDQMDEIVVNNLSEFRSIFKPFENYATQGDIKNKYLGIYNQFSGDTAYIGKSAYNFSLPDSTGRMISLEEFKGKVIFIDVWATWCGPCKEQFPFMKEIEHEYSGNKDIVFMGISIDRGKDRQKWLNMMKKENLGGVQLLDDMGKSFADKYDIHAIPRFLLVSKEGTWIEIRCPRPETKEDLKRYLDDALKQNALTAK